MTITGNQGFGGYGRRLIGGNPPAAFSPFDVPEVAAGRWWDSALFTNLGAATFRWTEQNDVTTEFDGLQAVVGRQPSQITTRGYDQWRFNAAASSVTTVGTAGPMGWTGATMVAGWVRFPSGVTGTNNTLRHNPSSGNRRLQLITQIGIASSIDFRFGVSTDGVAIPEFRWPTAGFDLRQFHYLEASFLPAVTNPLQRLELTIDRQLVSPSVRAAIGASLFDPVSAAITFAGINTGTGNVDVTDLGNWYYCNGIPSEMDRNLLWLYEAPIP